MAIPSETLLEEAKCYLCLGVSISEALELALLAGIASSGGGGSGVPSGVILMWSGTIATIPSGWALCNGSNGTPDLRNRFVVGAQQDDGGVAKTNLTGSLTVSGGSISHSHGITDPKHNHALADPPLAEETKILVFGVEQSVDSNASSNDAVLESETGITVNSQSAPQPYYALAYIMKT